jgi:hypothetical protein
MSSNKFFAIASILVFATILLGFGWREINPQEHKDQSKSSKGNTMTEKIEKTDKEWKESLTPEQYNILRQKGTERPFTGKYWNFDGDGI